MNTVQTQKLKKLKRLVAEKGSLAIAFSGGVDSTLIAKVAFDELGERSLAVTIDSESYSQRELDIACRIAGEIGIRHEVVSRNELDDANYVQNPVNRCYFCKKSEMATIKDVAFRYDIEHVAFGVNLSDFGEHRPGLKALKEDEAFHPLVEAALTKTEIVALAGFLGLSNYDLPSTTCLASRIPYGEKITLEKLTQVENAERVLFNMGVSQSRVRNYGELARIEVPQQEIQLLLENRQSVIASFKDLGFAYVTIDLEGYRSGSMNEIL